MLNPFKNLFGKKPSSVIGIDVGSSSIKVVQLSRKNGKAILETYGELALGPYGGIEIGRSTNLPPEQISTALVDVLRESKITTKNSAVAIPFGSSLISIIEMPAVAEKQYAQMIPLEARKYIPVPISEVALDWWVIPPDTNKAVKFDGEAQAAERKDKLDVLLVAIHNDTLKKYQTIITQAALETSFFEIEIFGTIRSALEQDNKTQMVVDFGAASTKVYLVEHGVIKTSHVVNRGSQDITLAISKSLGISVQDAEIIKRDMSQAPSAHQKDILDVAALTLEYVLTEANQVLLSYQKRYNKAVARVVLVGGGAQIKNLQTLAQSHFQTEVQLGNPFGKVETPVFLHDVLKDTGPEFAVAVGIALRKLQELE